MKKQNTLLSVLALISLLTCPLALADNCSLADGRSFTIDQAGNVSEPAELVGWRLSDKDDASGLEIYKRGSSPREALDVTGCSSGAAATLHSVSFSVAARELGTCYCACDKPTGEIISTGKEFEGADQYVQCEAACVAGYPDTKSVCER